MSAAGPSQGANAPPWGAAQRRSRKRGGPFFSDQFATMKLHLQTLASNVVTGFGVGWIRIGVDEYRENIVLLPDMIVKGWAPAGFEALDESDFARLLDYKPEIVLLGTGATQRFPHPGSFA